MGHKVIIIIILWHFPVLCTLILKDRDLYNCLYSILRETEGKDQMFIYFYILALSSLCLLHSVVSSHQRQARMTMGCFRLIPFP